MMKWRSGIPKPPEGEIGIQWVEEKDGKYYPTEAAKEKCYISDPQIYEDARKDPLGFWFNLAEKEVKWFKKPSEVHEWKLPYIKWFMDGITNLAYNVTDYWIEEGRGNELAMIWEPEPVDEDPRFLTYKDLHRESCKLANALSDLGISRGDIITFWMPMIPETLIGLLACQRIGAPHSVVFTAFAPSAVKERMEDSGSKILVTADAFYRRDKKIELKPKIDDVLEDLGAQSIVVERCGTNPSMKEDRDRYWSDLTKDASAERDPEPKEAESLSFLLYTSGTTGKPKGVQHASGGYILGAKVTSKWIFDTHPGDVLFSTADIGWITGHSYTCYGPILNGATTLWYEGAPEFPEPDRLWQIIEKYNVTQFYTAPTLLRMLMRVGDEWPEKHKMQTLRVLGTVGEPIGAPEWRWYFEKVGKERCPIVDTYWQTETGGILITALPGVGPFIPAVAGPAIPGVNYDVLDERGSSTDMGESGKLVVTTPYAPMMLRGLYKRHDAYVDEYFSDYCEALYFSGDGATKIGVDERMGEMLFQITGRVDDVLEVAGHRLGTAEVEGAVKDLEEVSDSAVVPKKDEVRGEVPSLWVVLKRGCEPSDELNERIVNKVREDVGPLATPKEINFVNELPMTKSGKIIRRFLKSILADKPLGDTTTAYNPECLKEIAEKARYKGPDVERIPGYEPSEE